MAGTRISQFPNLPSGSLASEDVLLVVDRWEISGYPLLSSKKGQSWSPNLDSNNGCISSGPCSKSSQSNKYPYGCADGTPGYNNNYCRDTNDVISILKDCNNFYIFGCFYY